MSPLREEMSKDLLEWYDMNARAMPWRMGPDSRRKGELPDPYGVWLSEVMLQQTTVAAVRDYWRRFIARWPTVIDLAQADDADVMAQWAGLGYYARARNLLKCARVISEAHQGSFPRREAELLKLPGIGPYTAASVAAIAYDEAATVVDGNVERVISRIYAIETPLPQAKSEIRQLAEGLTNHARPGDYAQAIMDLGATICTPQSPACSLCPWRGRCEAQATGRQVEFPKKAPKKPKPTRRGYVQICGEGDIWNAQVRPATGLLGGMLGFPGSDWIEGEAPVPPDGSYIGQIRHTFTHFHLELDVYTGQASEEGLKKCVAITGAELPTVFRKAFELVQSHAEQDQ